MTEIQVVLQEQAKLRAIIAPGVPVPDPNLRSAPFSAIFPYRADTSSTGASDPGSGMLRWNAADVNDVTALYFDRLGSDGNDYSALFGMVAPRRLIIQEASLAVNQQHWTVTGPVIQVPDWFQVPVVIDPSRGTPFKPNNFTAILAILII
jgi:hypothetical protein